MRKQLSASDLGDLLVQPRLAVFSTHYPDGTDLLSPVWHEWDDGGFTVVTGAKDLKIRHLRRDPRTSIVVAEDVRPYRGIEVRGRATISTDGTWDILLRIAIRYLGPGEGTSYANGTKPEDLAVVRIVPGVLRAWDFADEY